jgi:hypothetical protein
VLFQLLLLETNLNLNSSIHFTKSQYYKYQLEFIDNTNNSILESYMMEFISFFIKKMGKSVFQVLLQEKVNAMITIVNILYFIIYYLRKYLH